LQQAQTGALLTDKIPEISVPVTDEDVQLMKEKEDLRTLWDFDRWVVDEYLGPLDAPEKKDWLRRRYPEFFDRMIEAMKELNEAKAKYEKMRIDTPKSIGDLWFLYTFERDYPMYKNNIQSLMNNVLGLMDRADADEAGLYEETAFQRGMWNLRKRFNEIIAISTLPIHSAVTENTVPQFEDRAKTLEWSLRTRPKHIGIRESPMARVGVLHDRELIVDPFSGRETWAHSAGHRIPAMGERANARLEETL